MTTTHIGERFFIALVVLAVVAVAITGLILSGPPSQERARRIDQQRVNDLQSITYNVNQYYSDFDTLPTSLDEMVSRLGTRMSIMSPGDPATGQPYEYRAIGADQYELCATFAADSADLGPQAARIDPYGKQWEHVAGKACFTRTVQPTPKPVTL